jgi:hypothetical protein
MLRTWLLLSACGADPDAVEPVDETIVWETDRENTIRFDSPVYEVPPYADQTMCVFGSYDGGDVGITWAGFYQNMNYGHHVVLMASEADEDEWPDGTVADCTKTDAAIMVDARPFLFAADLVDGSAPEMILPDGMGVKLKERTRFVIQSHHINPTDQPILVNDTVFLQITDVDTVETWTAPWVHTETDMVIEPGADATAEVTCTFDEDVYLLSLLGHLHEWGTAYEVDHHKLDGAIDRVYEVPQWDVAYRDAPPITFYQPGERLIRAGESFTTRCSWHNDTPDPLTFPTEMCATVGFAYPLVVPIICEGAL